MLAELHEHAVEEAKGDFRAVPEERPKLWWTQQEFKIPKKVRFELDHSGQHVGQCVDALEVGRFREEDVDVIALEIEERNGGDKLPDQVGFPSHPGPIGDAVDERSASPQKRKGGLLGLDERGRRCASHETVGLGL